MSKIRASVIKRPNKTTLALDLAFNISLKSVTFFYGRYNSQYIRKVENLQTSQYYFCIINARLARWRDKIIGNSCCLDCSVFFKETFLRQEDQKVLSPFKLNLFIHQFSLSSLMSLFSITAQSASTHTCHSAA